MRIIEPDKINFWEMLDVIKRHFSQREVRPHIKNIKVYRWYNRYIQFATSYYPYGLNTIHYEYCSSGFLELHFEGEYKQKIADLALFLYNKTQDDMRFTWESRNDYSIGTCRYEKYLCTQVALDKAIIEFCSIIDKILEEFKINAVVDYDDKYNVLRNKEIEDYVNSNEEKGVEVSLVDNMTLNDILHLNINIPPYQRIYCWDEKNVRKLLADVSNVISSYRLGPIILHRHDGMYDIIDGQQRLVTLSLILKKLGTEISPLLKLKIKSKDAVKFISYNASLINDYINAVIITGREKHIDQILNNIEFSVLILNTSDNLDLAYTFFSNENSRGKSLSDFDLLKAHHLRYIRVDAQAEHIATTWDGMLNDANMKYEEELSKPYFRALGLYVFRLRKWMHRDEWDDFGRFRIKQEYEAAPIIDEIPPFGEQFKFNESIQGGTHFFAFVKQFEYRFHIFTNTKEYQAIHKLNTKTHWWFRDVIETFLFAYFLKFGEEYLAEALIGISRIIAQYRYNSDKADYGRLLRQADDSSILFMIERATSPTFVIAELLQKIKNLPAINVGLSPIAIDFRNSLRTNLVDIIKNKIIINDFKHVII